MPIMTAPPIWASWGPVAPLYQHEFLIFENYDRCRVLAPFP